MSAKPASVCVAVLLAVPFSMAQGSDFGRLPDRRITDATGRYYVAVGGMCGCHTPPPHWKQAAVRTDFAQRAAMAFTIAERAPGTPPVSAHQIDLESLQWYQPDFGAPYHLTAEQPDVGVRPGDIVHGRGLFETPPRVVLVSSTGLGFVALDVFDPDTLVSSPTSAGHAVVVFSLQAKLRHAKTVSDLFAAKEIQRFGSVGGTVSWLRCAWINEDQQELVILGGNDELRVLNLVSGEVHDGREQDVLRGLASVDPGAVKQALIVSADRKLRAAKEPARRVLAHWETRPDVRLRAAVALAVLGDPSGAELIRKTAVAQQQADSKLEGWDRQFQRAVAIEYLPEAIGERALPLLAAALGGQYAEGTAAFKALVKLGDKSVPVLAPMVVAPQDRRLRLAAIGVLGSIGPSAGAAADELAKALEDEDPLVRIKAAFALANIDPTQQRVLPVLRQGLRFELDEPWSVSVREAAVESLVRLGPDGFTVLGDALENEEVAIRRTIASGLSRLGPEAAGAAPALVETLDDADRQVRDWALQALSRMGSKALPALVCGLRSQPASIRSGCAFVLGRFGPAASRSIPILRSALEDDDPLVRIAAAGALCQIDPAGSEAVITLIELLKHPREEVRAKAAFRLGQLGQRAEAAIDPLIALLCDRDRVAAAAASALGRIGPEASAAVPHLIQALSRGGRLLRRDAAESLGRFGTAAKTAVPALIERLEDDDWHVPHLAATALGRIASDPLVPMGGHGIRTYPPPHVIPALTSAIQHGQGDPDLRLAAVEALGRLGPAPSVAVPVLVEALADPCPAVGQEAVNSVAKFGSHAVPRLVEALKHPSKRVRSNAARALGLIGPDAEAAVPALIEALADADAQIGFYSEEPLTKIGAAAVGGLVTGLGDEREEIRSNAARILGRIGPEAEPAVDALVGALQDPEDYVRSQAAYALGNIGPGAQSAIDALNVATQDESSAVRRAAVQAFEKIQK